MRLRDDAADAQLAASGASLAYLPSLLAYPLRGFCLPVILMLSAFAALGTRTLFGLPLLAITVIWSLHYLLAVIERSARGHATPPPMSAEVAFLGLATTVKALLMPAAAMVAYFGLNADGHRGAAGAVLVSSAFVAPAYLFTLAVEDSFVAAINPLRWLQTIAALGLSYLLPCALLAAGALALAQLAGGLGVALLTAAICYVALAGAHAIGVVAYHRREQLGLDVEVRDPAQAEAECEQEARLARVTARVDACLAALDLPGAVRALDSEAAGPASVHAYHEMLFQRLSSRGHPELLHALGRRLVGFLLREHRGLRALEVFERCEHVHPGFEPESPVQRVALAQVASDAGYDRLLETLLADFGHRHAGDPAEVDAALLLARHLAERRHDEPAARALLLPLLARTTHPRHAQVQAYLRALEATGNRREPGSARL